MKRLLGLIIVAGLLVSFGAGCPGTTTTKSGGGAAPPASKPKAN